MTRETTQRLSVKPGDRFTGSNGQIYEVPDNVHEIIIYSSYGGGIPPSAGGGGGGNTLYFCSERRRARNGEMSDGTDG